MNNTLTRKEVNNLQAGRILNTLIQEYVFNEFPSRWSNGEQKELPAHWFEEHPRQCAEDDGGYCSADSLADYSTDISRAMSISNASLLKGKSLSTHTDQKTLCPSGFSDPDTKVTYWATFTDVPFEKKAGEWMTGSTLAVAICKAALVSV